MDGILHHAWTVGPSGQIHLCVEALPGGGWDWLVWPAANPADNHYGVVATRESAMSSAERALAQFERSALSP